MTALTNVIFQRSPTAGRNYLCNPAAIVTTEAGLGWCSADRTDKRQWILHLAHDLYSRSFLFCIKRNSQPNQTLAGCISRPNLAGRGASWLTAFVLLRSCWTHIVWSIQEKFVLLRSDQQVFSRLAICLQSYHQGQLIRLHFK